LKLKSDVAIVCLCHNMNTLKGSIQYRYRATLRRMRQIVHIRVAMCVTVYSLKNGTELYQRWRLHTTEL